MSLDLFDKPSHIQPALLTPLELSIIMPCLNEAETLERCIRKAQHALAHYDVHGEIIIADNGSSDGSQQVAERAGARVVPVAAKGYGSALMGGIVAARGQYVIMGDADDSYDFTSIGPFVDKLRAGYDLVMGNRFAGGIAPGAMPPLHRYFGNPLLSGIGQLLFRSPVSDFHCGLRGFRRDAILALDLRTTGMEFASEMIVKATLNCLRITEVPTTLSPDGRSRAPHLRSWRDGWRHLRFMLLYSPEWLFLYPGVALMVVGLLVGMWLLGGAQVVGRVVLDVHTLLYAAMAIVLGFQSVLFAAFTKVFAITEGLLPESPHLTRLFRYVTLEVGLLVGCACVLVGLLASLVALQVWGSRSFGDLEPTVTLRTVIPAVTLLLLGCQMILSSFFLSILGLRRR